MTVISGVTRLVHGRSSKPANEIGAACCGAAAFSATEGAIPFAAKDPLRVIPALMIGSAVAAALSMVFGAELRVPHGGVFVLPIPNAVTHLAAYVLAIVAGTLVSTLALGGLKRPLNASAAG